jgi:hypothetical protein
MHIHTARCILQTDITGDAGDQASRRAAAAPSKFIGRSLAIVRATWSVARKARRPRHRARRPCSSIPSSVPCVGTRGSSLPVTRRAVRVRLRSSIDPRPAAFRGRCRSRIRAGDWRRCCAVHLGRPCSMPYATAEPHLCRPSILSRECGTPEAATLGSNKGQRVAEWRLPSQATHSGACGRTAR